MVSHTTKDTGTAVARGTREPTDQPLKQPSHSGAAVSFGRPVADQATYVRVNGARGVYWILFNTKLIHSNS
jgi:hypothetical protein